jgi:hypothetical protein
LVVAIGHLLLRLSEPAARELPRVLMRFLAAEGNTERQATLQVAQHGQ